MVSFEIISYRAKGAKKTEGKSFSLRNLRLLRAKYPAARR